LLVAGASVQVGVDLGARASFADLGATLAEAFGLPPLANGRSFAREIGLAE
jgi:phosphopentomutase